MALVLIQAKKVAGASYRILFLVVSAFKQICLWEVVPFSIVLIRVAYEGVERK